MALSQTFTVDASGNEVVSGTVAATQSGTWNVTNVSGTVTLPTGAATAAKQPALGTAGTASADVITVQGITSMTPLQVTPAAAATGTMSSVAGNASSATLLASNSSRKGFTLYNDSTAICRVAFGATASATAFTFLMQPNAYYENNSNYTGAIAGIWASATGNMRVTELT